MMDGELIQMGQPADIFYAPSDLRAARFVGVENILKGRIESNEGGLAQIGLNSHSVEAVTEHRAGQEVNVCIRPEEITISVQPPSSSARNSFRGEVRLVALSGPYARVEMDCGFALAALITRRSAEDLGLKVGQQLHASFKATAVHVISRTGSDQAETPGASAESSAFGGETGHLTPDDAQFWRWRIPRD
jgi:tungstate transport system ATP-binding protein